MPFSDLLRMTKGKTDFTTHQKTSPFSTDLSSSGGGGDADFYELVWENGQIVMQGQSSSRARKAAPTSSDLLSKQPTITDVKDANSSKMAKSGTMNHHTFPLSVTSCETALNHQDEELVPWLNYPLLEPLNNEYCSGLLPELSGVTENGLSSARNSTQPSSLAVPVDQSRTATNNALSSRPDNASKAIPRAGGVSQAKRGDHLGNANGMDQYTSSIQYCPSQTGGSASMNFSDKHEDRHQPSSYMNFSYLSRLASTPGPGNNNRNPVSITGGLTCRTQRFGSNNYDKGGALSSSTPTVSNIIHNPTVGCSRPAGDLTCRTGVSLPAVNNVANESKAPNHPVRKDSYLPPQQLGGVYIEDNVRNHNSSKQSPGAVTEGEKVAEPAVAASSICSRNSLEKDGSNEPGSHLKRKSSETGESESATEENEEESVGVRVVAAPRAGVKRSRAAEVHNLSERKRREKINEKMRALQELVPNCNKADKASMLDEAIEYLKTLQLQVQMLSMGTGFYIPPMLIPAAMQHIHRAQMSPFPPMPMGMGMGMGFGGLGSMHDLNNSTSMMQQMPSSCYPSLHAAASSPHIPASSSTFHLGYNGFPSSGQLSAPSHSTLPFQVVNPTMKLPISSPHVHGGTDAPSHVAPQSTTQNIMQNGSQVNNLDGSGNGPDNQVSAEATALLNAQPQANINAAHEAQKLAGVNSNNKPN